MQKAVVVIVDSPQGFGMMRERLGIVTQAWFAQREFTDTDILRRFQESLADEKARGSTLSDTSGRDLHLGMSLRELIHEFKWQALVLLKCCLLQPKVRSAVASVICVLNVPDTNYLFQRCYSSGPSATGFAWFNSL